jgi:hypothetical protein
MNRPLETIRTRGSLRKWGQALKDEGNPLGESLLAYAAAWESEVKDMVRAADEAVRDAAAEERWRNTQGEDYGSY